MRDYFQEAIDWVWENYPAYTGWQMDLWASEYLTIFSTQDLMRAAEDAMACEGEILPSSFEECVQKVIPPEGHDFFVFKKDNIRVGINVPRHVFQEQPQPD